MMNKVYGAYLEDYNLIKLIVPSSTNLDKISLTGNNYCQLLSIKSVESYANELHIFLNYKDEIYFHQDYNVVVGDLSYHLNVGKVTRTKRFEDEFYYDGPLGFDYHHGYTEFRIWSPVCKEIILCLNDKNYQLTYLNKGVWYVKVDGNFDGAKYYYIIRVDEDKVKTLDPYAVSSNANNEYNYVIDLDRTYQMQYSFGQLVNIQPIIYELNLRDMVSSINEQDSVYLRNMENLRYIKNLGITHLQFMPTFAFGGVDETKKVSTDDNFSYNWGYNPIQYMVPSGWYASNPNDAYARINELKELIDKAHEFNLSVNMDVVFNHVYSYENFSWGLLVPGYVYRTDERGFLLNSSYCGNDLRTEARMIQKYILDVVSFYQKFYKVDGFRFDLMGLIDTKTIALVVEKTKKLNPLCMIYGEGWYMNTTLPMHENANLGSAKNLPTVSFFNDYFRNVMGGSIGGNKGFILGDKLEESQLNDMIINGSSLTMPFLNPKQSINYLECHDNCTLYDKVIYRITDFEKTRNACMLGLGLVIISRGISFIHAGEELMRTKKGIDNSYNSHDDINHFPWENLDTKYDLRLFVKNLITIKNMQVLTKLDSAVRKDSYYEFRYNYGQYQLLIKNNYESSFLYFCPGTTLIFDNGLIKDEKVEKLNLEEPGIWILRKN